MIHETHTHHSANNSRLCSIWDLRQMNIYKTKNADGLTGIVLNKSNAFHLGAHETHAQPKKKNNNSLHVLFYTNA